MDKWKQSTKKKMTRERERERERTRLACMGENVLIQHFDFHCMIGQTVFFVYAMLVTTATSVPLRSGRSCVSECDCASVCTWFVRVAGFAFSAHTWRFFPSSITRAFAAVRIHHSHSNMYIY